VEAYYKEQGLYHTSKSPEAEYTQTLELDLGAVEPSVAGPKRPQDRVLLKDAAASFEKQLPTLLAPTAKPLGSRTAAAWDRNTVTDTALADKTPMHVTTTVKERFNVDPDKYLDHGSVVIAAITSCTNT
jgi:aconitate hydratase